MLLRNVSPIGGLYIPLIGREVEGGAEFEVTAPQAKRLLVQDIFEPADDAAKVVAFDLAAEAEAAAAEPEPEPVADVPLPETVFDDGWTDGEDPAPAVVSDPAAPRRNRGRGVITNNEGGPTE